MLNRMDTLHGIYAGRNWTEKHLAKCDICGKYRPGLISLVSEGLLTCEDGNYTITNKGIEIIEGELAMEALAK